MYLRIRVQDPYLQMERDVRRRKGGRRGLEITGARDQRLELGVRSWNGISMMNGRYMRMPLVGVDHVVSILLLLIKYEIYFIIVIQ